VTGALQEAGESVVRLGALARREGNAVEYSGGLRL